MRTFSDSDRPSSDAPMDTASLSDWDATSDSDFSVIEALDALTVSAGSSPRAGVSSFHDVHGSYAQGSGSGYGSGGPRVTASLSPSPSPSPDVDVDAEYEIILMPSTPSTASAPTSVASVASSVVLAPSAEPDSASAVVSSTRAQTPSARSNNTNVTGTTKSKSRASRSSRRRRGGDDLESILGTTDDAASETDSQASEATQRHSALPAARTRSRTQARTARSVLSASDAQASIDTFFNEPEIFMSDKANKLRLWQALCIEFGLVELEGSIPPSLPDLPSSDSATSSVPSSVSSSRSTTPTPSKPALPTSLTQARLLLKSQAHVNIVQYIDARDDPARHAQHGPDTAGKYADLLYESASAMQRATRKARKFHPLSAAKQEWLEPLLKDFGMSRRRAAY